MFSKVEWRLFDLGVAIVNLGKFSKILHFSVPFSWRHFKRLWWLNTVSFFRLIMTSTEESIAWSEVHNSWPNTPKKAFFCCWILLANMKWITSIEIRNTLRLLETSKSSFYQYSPVGLCFLSDLGMIWKNYWDLLFWPIDSIFKNDRVVRGVLSHLASSFFQAGICFF